jgi:hypothetical protein
MFRSESLILHSSLDSCLLRRFTLPTFPFPFLLCTYFFCLTVSAPLLSVCPVLAALSMLYFIPRPMDVCLSLFDVTPNRCVCVPTNIFPSDDPCAFFPGLPLLCLIRFICFSPSMIRSRFPPSPFPCSRVQSLRPAFSFFYVIGAGTT